MSKEFVTKNKEETQQLSVDFLNSLDDVNVALLSGDLGAGKTTFCQGILKALNAEGPFTSPTFVVVKEYLIEQEKSSNNQKLDRTQKFSFKKVYHWDCYRINVKDALELGWEEIVTDPNNLVLVEWPEKIQAVWPKKYLLVDFERRKKKEERKIVIEKKDR
ncbi:MAG TPA: tRNA (adenosine(37)-N6)-threonylcarbamoyltransferase complex ATPase subunit type 1 TsaE [Candidatus Moranbacteria bacterium]|nr:tRNA (adenosine(37)-N6)-threonylcarbamoyltransferase complex ATPase subunit type 1 TsaE [Candidatus Moranbacteria bacterium]